MKKNIASWVLAALAVLFSAGCEKIIEFNGEVTKPLLTISSYAEVGNPLTVYVASSIFFLSDQKNGAAFTDGLDTLRGSVRCFVNGAKEPRTLQRLPEGDHASFCYQDPGYAPQPGDHIRLEAEFPGFEPVWAETDVPLMPSFEVLSAKWNKVSLGGLSGLFDDEETEYDELEITLAVTDDASYDKYYFLEPVSFVALEWMPEGYWTKYAFSSNDVIFRELNGGDFGSLPNDSARYYFSDALIKGRRHTFTITTDLILDRENISYFGVIAATVNESLYWYDLSFHKVQGGLAGILEEGMTLYSNVHGGYGVFGASAPVLLDVEW